MGFQFEGGERPAARGPGGDRGRDGKREDLETERTGLGHRERDESPRQGQGDRDAERQKKDGEKEAKAKPKMPGAPPNTHAHTCTHAHACILTCTLAQHSETWTLVLLWLLKGCVTFQNTSPPSEPLVPLRPGEVKLVPGR